ncbi:hypothetical protein [Streptomyces sp. ISL-86]|uniref:hypothetical protein n=1 Tax=Streptomyces sp. ISL-86 TaxID=2819187 RepID=UPI001BEC6D67|nr:hypothetical protein [Streptomyces sp. ISL-86]MBT2460060.1 hypothetical protein [Streptomyces sp. ISL-86]
MRVPRRPDGPGPPPLPLWAGLGAVVCGVLLCVAGWYGVSGERFAERQLPYLASCTVPGAALLVAGAVLLTRWPSAEPSTPVVPPAHVVPPAPVVPRAPVSWAVARSSGPPVRVPGGSLAHRPDCPLVDGRAEVSPAADADGLSPCPVCEPPWPL